MNVKTIFPCVVCTIWMALTGCQREPNATILFEIRAPSQSIADALVKKTFVPDAPTMTLEQKGTLYLIGVEDSDPQRAVDRVKRTVKTMTEVIERENSNIDLFILEDAAVGMTTHF